MEFSDEMNAFIDWLETNPLEPSAQTLWMHLLVIANKSGYPEWFAVANPLLQAKVGISEKSLTKHRNTLVQKGLIEYKNQGKQQAGKYRINLLTEHLTGNFTVNRGVKCSVNRVVKGTVKPSVYKDLKDLKSSSAASTNYGDESFTAAYARVWRRSLTPFQSQNLGKYIDEDGLDEQVIIRAIERAALNGKGFSFGLITKILNDYLAARAFTLEAAIAFDEQFEASKVEYRRPTAVREPANRRQRDIEDLQRRMEEAQRIEQGRDNIASR